MPKFNNKILRLVSIAGVTFVIGLAVAALVWGNAGGSKINAGGQYINPRLQFSFQYDNGYNVTELYEQKTESGLTFDTVTLAPTDVSKSEIKIEVYENPGTEDITEWVVSHQKESHFDKTENKFESSGEGTLKVIGYEWQKEDGAGSVIGMLREGRVYLFVGRNASDVSAARESLARVLSSLDFELR